MTAVQTSLFDLADQPADGGFALGAARRDGHPPGARPRRLGGPAARVAERGRLAVRRPRRPRCRGGRSGARCTSGWSTCRGWSASTATLDPLPAPGPGHRAGVPQRALPDRAGRAVHHRRAVPLPRRPGLGRLARRHHRPQQDRGHHGRHRVARLAPVLPAATAGRRRDASGTSSATATCLVMGGSCQRTWEHAIPKTSRSVGPRISVQFRPRAGAVTPAGLLLHADAELGFHPIATDGSRPRPCSRPAQASSASDSWRCRPVRSLLLLDSDPAASSGGQRRSSAAAKADPVARRYAVGHFPRPRPATRTPTAAAPPPFPTGTARPADPEPLSTGRHPVASAEQPTDRFRRWPSRRSQCFATRSRAAPFGCADLTHPLGGRVRDQCTPTSRTTGAWSIEVDTETGPSPLAFSTSSTGQLLRPGTVQLRLYLSRRGAENQTFTGTGPFRRPITVRATFVDPGATGVVRLAFARDALATASHDADDGAVGRSRRDQACVPVEQGLVSSSIDPRRRRRRARACHRRQRPV